ncbi:hypothetical protein [Amnibacterium endophyticum]|uniref:Uncharacterized protein n=1 Tax=Amnibacterium endophyticum TaxID=2109337 RepID=A0ABW4LDS9_9MICO
MSNPASELAVILRAWRVVPKNQSVSTHRTTRPGDGGRGMWAHHRRAAGLLLDVERVLRAMKASGVRVEHYERGLDPWSRVVWAPQLPFGAGQSNDVVLIEESSIDLLDALGDYLDATSMPLVSDETRILTAQDALKEALDLLTAGGVQLGAAESRYVTELIAQVQDLLNDPDGASIDLLHRIYELFGVLSDMADRLEVDRETRETGRRLRAVARRISPWALQVTVFGIGALDAAANLKSLLT